MNEWLNNLNSQEVTWLTISLVIVIFGLGTWLILNKLKTKKNYQVWVFIGFFGCLLVPMIWLINLSDYKKKFEEAQLLDVLEIEKNQQKYLLTLSLSVTSSKSSTTHWLPYDILEANTGKRIKRGIIRLGSIWDLKILSYSEPYIWLTNYGIKLLDPWGEKEEFVSENQIQAFIESKFPSLKDKIAKLELKQENVGLIAKTIAKNGEQTCIRVNKWQTIDCQQVNTPAYIVDSKNEKPKTFTYFNFLAYFWRDSTWVTMGLPDKNNPYKSKFYRHVGTPSYSDGISVTITEGDSTRSLLPQKRVRGRSFPERLEPFGNQEFVEAQFLFITGDLAILKNKMEVGGSTRLTAFDLSQQKIKWQIETSELKLHANMGVYFQVKAINEGKNLLLYASKQYPISSGAYRLVCLDTQSGRKQWEYNFK